ncbi:MAG: response regulator [Sphingobacteriales bacterium]|nr:MAG: response regulator [Sphingobacteriales bacterium]
MKSGPIVLVEDDEDDKNIFEEVLGDLGVDNELLWFNRSSLAFTYLKAESDQPFLIVCDVNMPGQNGIDLKAQIDSDAQLRRKSIPFIFYSTSVDKATVTKAYTELTVQGFFKKLTDYEEIKRHIKLMMDYWSTCYHPNTDQADQ